MAEPVLVRPGQKVKVSGQYRLAQPDGTLLNDASEYTLVEGEPAPPAPRKGLVYVLVDASRHTDTPPDLPVATEPIPGMPPAGQQQSE